MPDQQRAAFPVTDSDPERHPGDERRTIFPMNLGRGINVLRALFVLTFFGMILEIPAMTYVFGIVSIILGLVMGAGMFLPNSSLFGYVFSRGSTDKRTIALTFDDGPDQVVTPQVLDILASKGVPATFFVIGERAECHLDILSRMHAEGHEIENHTWRHPVTQAVWPLNRRYKIELELRRLNGLISDITGELPRFVRFPAGIKSIPLMKAVSRLEMIVAGFSARAFDSRGGRAREIKKRLLASVGPGAIIVLHDGARIGRETSPLVEVLPVLLDYFLQEGYRFVRLDDLHRGLAESRNVATAEGAHS